LRAQQIRFPMKFLQVSRLEYKEPTRMT